MLDRLGMMNWLFLDICSLMIELIGIVVFVGGLVLVILLVGWGLFIEV